MVSRRGFVRNSALAVAAAVAQIPLGAGAITQASGTRTPRFGVNYVPRKRWWYCWLDWDQQAILDDLHGVASLGMDHIRIQCLWSLFQPGINNISDRILDNLHSLLDAADRAGLDVEVTVLNGWMSGLSFLPAWVAPLARPENGDDHNIFTSEPIIEAEKLLFRRIAGTIGRHKRFLGFDIGNELGVLQGINNPASQAAADKWVATMLGVCEDIAPGRFHVNGADHTHWFNDFGFSRAGLATMGSATVIHSYINFDGVLERFKYSDPASLHLAEYEVELAAAYATDPKRLVWVEETGVGNKEMPESYKPQFMDSSVRAILSTGKAWGITWWCSHDIDPSIKDFSDYEYGLGLLDLRNRPKPMGVKFKELAAEFRRSAPQAEPRRTALVIPDTGLSTKSWPSDWRFASAYMQLLGEGKAPAIVLESRVKDEAYLKERGIADLIPLAK
jgi:endo-1,4-beta-mannosidase